MITFSVQIKRFSSPYVTLTATIWYYQLKNQLGYRALIAPTLRYTHKGDPSFYVAVSEVVVLDGPVGFVQLPGDARVGEEEEQAGDEGAEDRQGHDEGGVVQGALVPDPVHGAGQSEGLRAVTPPAQQREDSPQACVQPDPTDHPHDGLPFESVA